MYIAMNRFRVRKGAEADFEAVWLNREIHLDRVPGFVEFHLLRGPEREDHVLYSSHTVWRSEADFVAWTRSEAFAPPTRMPAATSRSIRATPSSKASPCCRRSNPDARSAGAVAATPTAGTPHARPW